MYDARGWKQLLEYSKRIRKGEVYLNEEQQGFVRRRIAEIAAEGGASISAAHIGPNHVHVLVRPGDGNLSKLVQRLKGVTSRELSEHGLEGHVWSRGYHARRIRDDDLKDAMRYVSKHK